MEYKGYKSEVVKTENGFKVVWSDNSEVEKDYRSLNLFFKMAMEVINIAVEHSSNGAPFYWINGRKEWTLDQCNAILEHIGVVNFLHTLDDNTGGKDYKYAINMLDAYRKYLETGKPASIRVYKVDSLLEWMKRNIQNFHLLQIPAFQEVEEEGRWHLVNNNGVYSEYWEDFEVNLYPK